MAAYKIGAQGGDPQCQFQLGNAYYTGQGGVDMDYEQALPWIQKAAAQDDPKGVGTLGTMYASGHGVAPSWRRSREYYERSIGLGLPEATMNMQILTENMQVVRNERAKPRPPIPFVARSRPRTHF